jgi:SCP-2 sterol transfer family
LAAHRGDHIPAVSTATRPARTQADRTSADPISDFFASLTEPGHIATFEREYATLRFDVGDSPSVQSWYVTVHDGDVTVTRQKGAADAVVRISRPYLEAIVTGRMNAQAALLRGLLDCDGKMAALMMFQRCLPGPPGSTGKVAPISSQTVMAQRRPK